MVCQLSRSKVVRDFSRHLFCFASFVTIFAAAKNWCLNELVDSVRCLRSSVSGMLTCRQGVIKDAKVANAWLAVDDVSEMIDGPTASLKLATPQQHSQGDSSHLHAHTTPSVQKSRSAACSKTAADSSPWEFSTNYTGERNSDNKPHGWGR